MKYKNITKVAINHFDANKSDKTIFEFRINNFQDLKKLRKKKDHWDNKKNIEKDYIYIFNLYLNLSKQISTNLNKIHKKNFSYKYWEILIGPWLWSFLDNTYERYNSIKFFLKKNRGKKFYVNDFQLKKKITPNLVEQIPNYFYNSFWNYECNINIIKTAFKHKIFLKKKKSITKEKKFSKYISYNENKFKKIEITYYTNIISNNYLIFEGTFSKKILLEYFLNLKSFPIKKKIVFTNIGNNFLINSNIRKKISISLSNKNKYEKFISNYIKEQIPKCLIENYSSIFKTINNSKLPNTTDKILSSTSLWFKTIETFYIADQTVNKSSQLDYFQHGAEYGYSDSFNEYHEKSVSKHFYTWGWNEKSKSTIPYKITKNKITINNYLPKNKILIILRTSKQYFRLGTSQIGLKNWINYLNECLNIPKYLKKFKKKEIIVRFYKTEWFNQKKIWKDLYPDIEYDYSFGEIKQKINSSKVVICTYLSTLFFELIHINYPVVLLYPLSTNLIRKKELKYFKMLRDSNILFETGKELSMHINNTNIEKWWNSKKNQKIISILKEKFCK